MNGKLIFFEGAYATLDLFAEELRRIYEARGYETFVMRAEDMEESLGRLVQFAAGGADAVITFNNLGFYLEMTEGKNLWDELHIPCVNILMDHPFRYHRFLLQAPERGIVLCPDYNHVEYIRRFYPNISRAEYLAHGGIPQTSPLIAGNETPKPILERTIDVLYAGSLSRYAAEGLVPDLGNITDYDGFDLSQSVLSELLRSPERTTESVMEEYFVRHGLHFPDERLREEMARLRFLDTYAVSFFREQAVRYLVENGIRVTVYGQGWEQCEWAANPNLTCGGVISPDEVVRKMGDAKIVLNTMTWFKNGTHDRVFNGMLAGAGVVSDTSVYMEKEFADKQEIACFNLPEIGKLPTLVKGMLEEPGRLERMASAGYEKAYKNHTWESRAKEILEILGAEA